MSDVTAIVRKIREHLAALDDDDDDDFIARSRAALDDLPKAAVLEAIFREYPGLISGSLLMNLGFWFESITYQDVLDAMVALGTTTEASYSFARYVPEILGVDIKRAALDLQQRHPDLHDQVQYVVSFGQILSPTTHAIEYMRERQASPERIRASLERSGAPLLPLPEPA